MTLVLAVDWLGILLIILAVGTIVLFGIYISQKKKKSGAGAASGSQSSEEKEDQ